MKSKPRIQFVLNWFQDKSEHCVSPAVTYFAKFEFTTQHEG